MMKRYFLHVQEPSQFIEDPEGAEFESLDLAIVEAKAAARELVADRLECAGPLGIRRSMNIGDESGNILATIPFKDALIPED